MGMKEFCCASISAATFTIACVLPVLGLALLVTQEESRLTPGVRFELIVGLVVAFGCVLDVVAGGEREREEKISGGVESDSGMIVDVGINL